MRRHLKTLLLIAGALPALTLIGGCNPPAPWQKLTPERWVTLETHRVRGIAALEVRDVTTAAREFDQIRRLEPQLGLGHLNYAWANVKTPRDGMQAAEQAVRVMKQSGLARLVHARLLEADGKRDAATPVLQEALKLEPSNPRVVGAVIKHLQTLPGDNSKQLLELSGRLVKLAPGNLAAVHNEFGERLQQPNPAALPELVGELRRLLGSRISVSIREKLSAAESKLAQGAPDATTACRILLNVSQASPLYKPSQAAIFGNDEDYADLALRQWDVPPPTVPRPELAAATVTWEDRTTGWKAIGWKANGVQPVALGDVDLWREKPAEADDPVLNTPDVRIGSDPAALWINRHGSFSGGGPSQPGSVVLADLNNDFSLDQIVRAPAGSRVIWSSLIGTDFQTGKRYPEIPELKVPSTPLSGGDGFTLPADLDQDGDLDLVLGDKGKLRYLRNNGDRTFSDLTGPARFELAGETNEVRGIFSADFNGDGAPDVCILRQGGAPQFLKNLRQDTFAPASDWLTTPCSSAQSGVVVDLDRDRDWDLILVGDSGQLLRNQGGGKFQVEPLAAGAAGDEHVVLADIDNDTWPDLVIAGTAGIRWSRNDQGTFATESSISTHPSRFLRVSDLDTDGDGDAVVVDQSGSVGIWMNQGGNTRPWCRIELKGLIKHSGQANNSFAIGAVVEAVTPWDAQPLLVDEPSMLLGLGVAPAPVVIRMTWTHGVPQDRMGPKAQVALRHEQVPTGSCPFLYVFDGERWRFLCDFNWRSPLGMLFARGAPIPHDQTRDWVKLDGDLVKPLGDYIEFSATEELREISYFDQIELLAVDHPQETSIHLDERFRMGPPAPFRIYEVRSPRSPVSARSDAGEDLTDLLAKVDGRYTRVPSGRYRGIVAPHDLILDLGKVQTPEQIRLFLRGWIFPANTSTNVAAGQNRQIKVVPPRLSVGDGQGGWKLVDTNVGLPCGKNKTLVLELGNHLNPADPRVKLTTTMEIRWDAAWFTEGETGELSVGSRVHTVPLAEAELRERGYGARYRERPDGPDLYDYNRLLPQHLQPRWPSIPGDYTRLGVCTPLLKGIDDRYAIVAPGDELRMSFRATSLPPVSPGFRRDFILRSDGWTKDSDPNTVTGESVEPLPYHGMTEYPYSPKSHAVTATSRRWRDTWNTRRLPNANPKPASP